MVLKHGVRKSKSMILIITALATLVLFALAWAQGAPGDDTYQNSVHQVIKDNKAQVRSCYEEQLKLVPDLKGDLKVTIEVTNTGKVGGCKTTESTFAQKKDEIANCACEKIKLWEFPKPADSGFGIDYTFKFKPEEPKATPALNAGTGKGKK